MHVYVYVCIFMYMYVCIYVYVYIYVYVRMYVYIPIYIYKYIYIHNIPIGSKCYKLPIPGQNWSCLLSGGSMTVTFLGVAAPAKMCSPPT